MSNTLVMTVGTGKTGEDIAQALLLSIQQHQPERVIFLCTEMTAEQTLPLIKKDLDLPPESCEVHVLPNENDVQFLYQEYLDRIRSCEHIIVDFTSGTKAMSAALFAAGIAVEADQVSYVVGPRDETGRVIQSEEAFTFPPTLVLAERTLERARDLFNRCDFHAASVLADYYRRTLPESSDLRRLAKTLYLLGTAYDCWDHFQYKQATNLVGKAANPRENLIDLDVDLLKSNSQFLHNAAREDFCAERLVDLANNARRRLQQGRFDDALARLYRAYEFLIQFQLITKYTINTNGVTLSELDKYDLCSETKKRYRHLAEYSDGKIKLGLREGLELLAELKDDLRDGLINLYWKPGSWQPGKITAAENAGPLQSWLNQRNNSFLAHGTKPAEEQTVKCLLNEYDQLLETTVPDLDKLQSAATMIQL